MADLRRRQAVDTWLQEPYLDAVEQEQVILHLKEQQASMSRQWTIVFAALAAVLGAGWLYLSWQQMVDPWGFRHHAFFYGVAGQRTVAFGEACSSFSLLLSAGALVTSRRTSSNSRHIEAHVPMLFGATACALCVGLYWSYALYKAGQYQDTSLLYLVRYIWMPCGPLLYTVLVRYLLHSFRCTARGVAALRASMYNLHSA